MEPTGPTMGEFGFWPMAFVAVYVFLLCYPIAKVLDRVGYSGLWSLIAIVPVANLVALWIFAFSDWPRLPRRPSGELP